MVRDASARAEGAHETWHRQVGHQAHARLQVSPPPRSTCVRARRGDRVPGITLATVKRGGAKLRTRKGPDASTVIR
jgi:hypothetical protein